MRIYECIPEHRWRDTNLLDTTQYAHRTNKQYAHHTNKNALEFRIIFIICNYFYAPWSTNVIKWTN